ncbi:histidine phosphatase family protein, partial [Hominenteromicrobium sp.]|uniref:histidine phosphatase family protein n=1 Tax=Hominenteromicrobium sp. TaxID=3073581 RepID=UPI003A8DD567
MPARRACRLCCADVLRHSDRLERGIAQMKIYLLRHGETAYNADHSYQGVTDIPLSPAGLA